MNENQKHTPITRFAEWVIDRRWKVLVSTVLIFMATGFGMSKIVMNNDYHVFFDKDNPHVLAFDALQEKYTKDDNVFIVIEPKSGEVFTKETLAAIAALEERSWQTPFSTRVDALSNFQHTHSEEDDMYVENLFTDPENMTDADLARTKKIALSESLLVNRLVNDKSTVTAVNVTVTLPADSMEAPMVVMAYVRNMVKEWQEDYPDHEAYLSGIIMLNGAFAEGSIGDLTSLVPLMFLIILIAVGITTRSGSGTFTAFFVLFFSIFIAMGLAGWAGIQLTGPSSSAPTMIMTLAIADSIHILVSMLQFMRKGMAKREAIVESIRVNFMPILITSATTIIGFLTLNFAEGAPFHDLGNITAVGVFAAFFLSIFLLPALMSILPVKVKLKDEPEASTPYLDQLAEFVIKHNKAILVASVAAVMGLAYLANTNELNNEFVKFFDKRVKFRTDTDFIADNLTGIYNMEFSLNSGSEDGISDPKYLQKLDEFEIWFRAQENVTHVSSFSEVMKRVNRSMHGDNQDYYKVPNGKNEAAQYLLLYEMSLPYGLDLNNQINVDKSETRFTVTMENVSSNRMLALAEESQNWLKENAPEEMFTHAISTSIMFSHITKTNMDAMLQSGFGALIIISFILIFALGSFKYGLISIVPNVAPIVVAFGIWAIFNGQINMAVTVVLGMTLGIVVDDTIHILAKYIRARKEMGKSAEDAIRYAFSTVGRAVVITTIILVAGFSVLMYSSFGFNSDMGKLTAITIVAALVLDLLLLPALLLTIDRKK
ncbi:MAG: MMPL family transporter [Flavobacteriales bacterium]|nr:MMPL family transporter [Flavobacteriales bacterium]